MPKSRTVLKRQRQNTRKRLYNKDVSSELKTLERRLRAAPDDAAARTELPALQKHLDQAAAKGTLHPNKAARKKSRLTRLVEKKS